MRTDTLIATGQLPKFADDAYHIERDDLWAIPTAEVPLTSIARDEILDEADLPMRLMAYTPCYRREAGAAGRDTRGLLRVHEFDKVEILAYTTPEQAPAMHAEILARAEGTLVALGLAYRVLEICTGDLGQSHARQFDLEVYAPGCDMWLEVSSVSAGSATTRPGGPTSATSRRRAAVPRSCTPSTARPWPCPECGPRSSRPTASPTAQSPFPTCSCPTSAAPRQCRLTSLARRNGVGRRGVSRA